MNKRILITALTLVAVLATVALAQQGHGRRAPRADRECRGPEARLEYMAEVLELTEEQQASIETIHEAAREEKVELKKSMARLRNEMEGEMLKDSPSEKTLIDLTEKLGAIRTEMNVLKVKTRIAVRALLTEDQQDQMMLMQRRHGRKDGRGRGHYPGCHSGRNHDCGLGYAPMCDVRESKI
jgi:Spy/CpxP family protein refolding chaperone